MGRQRMSQNTAEVSEAEIAVHWQEENYVNPPERFVAQANLTDKTVFDRFSLDNVPECFKEYANLLHWYRPWNITLDASNPPFWRWFVGGRINASYNCVDRHLAKYKNKTAIHFVPEPEHEAIQQVTYQELYVGRPKGCQHSTGGYLSYVAGTSKYIQDIHPEEVYWCMAAI